MKLLDEEKASRKQRPGDIHPLIMKTPEGRGTAVSKHFRAFRPAIVRDLGTLTGGRRLLVVPT